MFQQSALQGSVDALTVWAALDQPRAAGRELPNRYLLFAQKTFSVLFFVFSEKIQCYPLVSALRVCYCIPLKIPEAGVPAGAVGGAQAS